MKKQAINLILAAGLLFSASIVMAQGSRIAYVDGDKVVLESPQYQKLQKSLESDFKRRDNELTASQKQLQKLEKKLERDGLTMSKSERERLERDIRKRSHKLKSALEEHRDEFNIKRADAREKLQREVREVIQQVGKAEGYDLILTAGVVYYSDKVDITSKVVKRLERDFKSNK